MRSELRRVATPIETASVIALCAFAAHTLFPDDGSVAHFFDYRLYYGLVVVAAALTIARAVASPLHRGPGSRSPPPSAPTPRRSSSGSSSTRAPTAPPYPSIADAFYLGFYPASYVGLILLLRAAAAVADARALGRRRHRRPRPSARSAAPS